MLLRRCLLELASKSSRATTATSTVTDLSHHCSRKQFSTFFSMLRNKASSSSTPNAKEKASAADVDIGFVGKAFAASCSALTIYYIEFSGLDPSDTKIIVPIVEKVRGMFPITIGNDKFTFTFNYKGNELSAQANEELQENEKDGCS